MIPQLTNHLWQSTIFGIAAGLLAFAFRNNRAQIRYWLWCSASFKFLLPLSLLLTLGSEAHWAPAATREASPKSAVTILKLTEPFPETGLPATSPQPAGDWVAAAGFGIWACGFLVIGWIRFRGWLHIRSAVRLSIPISGGADPESSGAGVLSALQLPLEVRSSPGLLEPGVVGLFQPILLLPAGVADYLTPSQLEAVLKHELCHVRRRDNLFAAVHMLVEALFWFHPLVWWIGARMVEDRECACDEAVLGMGSEPRDYAEGILNICRNCLESPLRCVSGVTGSDLKKRIHMILSGAIAKELTFAKKAMLAAAAILALGSPIIIGVMNAPALRGQADTRPEFEVSSVRRCAADAIPAGGRGGRPSFSVGRMTLNCQSVTGLINAAYVMFASGRPLNFFRIPQVTIEGGPGWINSERYTISAKADGNQSSALMQGPMLQRLLENRFKLKIHRETREISIYELVVAKNGPKLQPFQEGSCVPLPLPDVTKPPAPPPRLPAGQRYCRMLGTIQGSNMVDNAQGITLEDFANVFLRDSGRPVVDKTGIPGKFAIHLEYAPSDELRQMIAERRGDPGDPTAPPIFTAIQEQLGLKLVSAKGPGEFLVIDHVERPSEN